MGKKKNIKGINPEDQELIALKMGSNPAFDLTKSISISNSFKIDFKCKNEKQKDYLRNIKDKSKEICFGVGSAGTGKSIVALAGALSQLKDLSSPYEKIIIFVPISEQVEPALMMGFLKGDLLEKTEPYKQMVINNIEKVLELSGNGATSKSIAQYLVTSGLIEFQFLNFCKGKTYEKSIILVEEAEDLSIANMLLLLTRKGGPTCKIICMGDDKQISRRDLIKNRLNSGLKFAAEILSDMPEVSVTRFGNEDIVRDPLLTEIIDRFDNPEEYRSRMADEKIAIEEETVRIDKPLIPRSPIIEAIPV